MATDLDGLSRKELIEKMEELAAELGVSVSALRNDAFRVYLEEPPETAAGVWIPRGSRTGRAKGFSLEYNTNKDGVLSSIKIIEGARGTTPARHFHRYATEEDETTPNEKSRARALRSARRAAQFDISMAGAKGRAKVLEEIGEEEAA